MKILSSIILLVALSLVFVFGLSLGVYTSHSNPDFYRKFSLFRNVIPAQPLAVDDSQPESVENIPVLSDVSAAETALASAETTLGSTVGSLSTETLSAVPTQIINDQMTLTNLQGVKLQATLLESDGEQVQIRRTSDGRKFPIRLDTLIPADQLAISTWRQSQGATTDNTVITPGEVDLDELFKMFDD